MIEYPDEFTRGVLKIIKLEQSRGQVSVREIGHVFFRVQRERLTRYADRVLKSLELDERGGHTDLMLGLRRLEFRGGLILLQSLLRLSRQIKLGQLRAQIGAIRLCLDQRFQLRDGLSALARFDHYSGQSRSRLIVRRIVLQNPPIERDGLVVLLRRGERAAQPKTA